MKENYPFGLKHPRVFFLEEEKRAINAKSILPLPFLVFICFDSFNLFSTYVIVCFLRVWMYPKTRMYKFS